MFRYLLLVGLAVWWPSAATGGEDALSLKPIKPGDWDRAKAAHLLRRAGFGGTPAQIDALVKMGVTRAVASLVDYEDFRYDPAPPVFDEDLRLTRGEIRQRERVLSEEERRKLRQQLRRKEQQAIEEVRMWWIERMVESPRPLEEHMTLFWHGHFTSGMREVHRARLLYEQNRLFRRYATGNFGALVHAVSKDPAMLLYLDGVRNRKRHPNENYARELMELFTLGIGHYTEKDIQESARAFTGWALGENGLVYRPRQHDFGWKHFLGRSGNFDGDDIVDIILDQKACSEYLARKLLVYFCRPDPHKRLVKALASCIRKNKYELKPVLRTLFTSRAFYAPSARGTLVKSPVELIVGTARSLGIKIVPLASAEQAISGMGQQLFQPPNVKGWDGGTKWIDTGSLFNRYNSVAALIYGGADDARFSRRYRVMRRGKGRRLDTGQTAGGAMGMMGAGGAAGSRLGRGKQPPFDPRPWIERYHLADAEAVVDFLSQHLLAVPLAADKRAALIVYLRGQEQAFDPADRETLGRVRRVMHLLCSTPEYQLN